MESPAHIPVLLDVILESGFPPAGTVFVDGTFGFGGHSLALLERYPQAQVIGLDRDLEIVSRAKETLKEPRLSVFHATASRIREALEKQGFAHTDGFLLDLGVSSFQLDTARRGFSFQRSGPLDMRMDQSRGRSAADLINSLKENELADIFFQFGEERFSRRIAAAIIRTREEHRIETTDELAKIVESAIPSRFKKPFQIHPATRVFQALRISVNDELEELSRALEEGFEALAPGGRLSVISFHSLEDRVVKTFFARKAKGCICPAWFPACTCGIKPTLKILTKKPVVAEQSEIARNPRSRSAKLRIAERLP